MYNQIRDYLKNPTEASRNKMAKAITKNNATGTISDAAKAWLFDFNSNADLTKSEEKLKSMFRVD